MPLNQQVEKCTIHRFLLSLFAPWRFLSRKPYLKGVQFGDFVDILIKNDDLCRHFGQIPPIEAASDMGRPPEPKPAHRFYPNFQIPTFVTPTENTLEGFFIYSILFLISPPKDCRICRFSRSKAALSFRQLENAIRTDFLGVFGGVSDLHQRSDFTESWASQCLWAQRSFGHTDFRLLRYFFFKSSPNFYEYGDFRARTRLRKLIWGAIRAILIAMELCKLF